MNEQPMETTPPGDSAPQSNLRKQPPHGSQKQPPHLRNAPPISESTRCRLTNHGE